MNEGRPDHQCVVEMLYFHGTSRSKALRKLADYMEQMERGKSDMTDWNDPGCPENIATECVQKLDGSYTFVASCPARFHPGAAFDEALIVSHN